MDRGCNIIQEVVNKTTPNKKKSKKAKWLSEEVLQIVEKQRKEMQEREGKVYIRVPKVLTSAAHILKLEQYRED